MAKPSNINPPCAGEPKTVEDTIEEPEDQTFFKISSNGTCTKEQEIIGFQQQLTDERKKRLLLNVEQMQLRRTLKS
jgi:hypothetical protein